MLVLDEDESPSEERKQPKQQFDTKRVVDFIQHSWNRDRLYPFFVSLQHQSTKTSQSLFSAGVTGRSESLGLRDAHRVGDPTKSPVNLSIQTVDFLPSLSEQWVAVRDKWEQNLNKIELISKNLGGNRVLPFQNRGEFSDMIVNEVC